MICLVHIPVLKVVTKRLCCSHFPISFLRNVFITQTIIKPFYVYDFHCCSSADPAHDRLYDGKCFSPEDLYIYI